MNMKSQGEIEAAICAGISRFEQDYMGRGPKDVHAYLIGDLLVVRLKGVLTVAEQQLVAALPAEKGRDLLKQVRIHLIETARPTMEAMVQEVTGVEVVSLHHDISTATGEEVVLFTLAESPLYRETRCLPSWAPAVGVLPQVIFGRHRQTSDLHSKPPFCSRNCLSFLPSGSAAAMISISSCEECARQIRSRMNSLPTARVSCASRNT